MISNQKNDISKVKLFNRDSIPSKSRKSSNVLSKTSKGTKTISKPASFLNNSLETNSLFKEKDLCCRHILEHRIELVPPAKKGTTNVKKHLFATIKKVCSEVVVISGFLRKTITYTAVMNGQEIPHHKIEDDISFEYLIESEHIQENDQFEIIEQRILGNVISYETNFGGTNYYQGIKNNLTFNILEKDIIKISIEILPTC
ncbi:hypothetical protein [Bacillus sp. CDB3]|uniref:hypothetical protein n=1 Tax=Bacillus sp. CDB3 TaxID=360310 RepID=UPI0009D869F9|nr:hypothetical protein [Bacillus sp. CDB3]OQR55183.1 hypothetical protein CDB3_19845 [Bacillus sp. CDB3]